MNSLKTDPHLEDKLSPLGLLLGGFFVPTAGDLQSGTVG